MIADKLAALDRETRIHSFAAAMRGTDSYQSLLKEGASVVPHLIEALPHVKSPMAFMLLLEEITGESPPPVKAPKLERIGWQVRNVKADISVWLART